LKPESVKVSYFEGKTVLHVTEKGERGKLLRDIFTEITCQLKCHYSDREVEDFTRVIAVFDYEEGGQ
jgi:hypothetical protein